MTKKKTKKVTKRTTKRPIKRVAKVTDESTDKAKEEEKLSPEEEKERKRQAGIKKRLANLAAPWKKGQSGNPRGMKKLTEIEKEARQASRKEIAEIYQFIKTLTRQQVVDLIEAKNETPVLVALFAASFLKGIKKGDLTALDKMYDRLLGKPKQTNEISGPDGKPVEINTSAYITKAKAIIAKRDKKKD